MTLDRLYLWIVFNVFVLGMLAIDLGVFHRKAHAVTTREATIWCIVWVSLGDRKSTRLNSSHIQKSRMPSSA